MLEHLSKKQLSEYSLGSIGGPALHEVGRHLIACESCRAELPAPTPAQFRKALLHEADRENEENVGDQTLGLFAAIMGLWATLQQQRTLAWTAAAVFVLLGLSFVMLLNRSPQSNMDSELALSPATERNIPNVAQNEAIEPDQNMANKEIVGLANSRISAKGVNLPASGLKGKTGSTAADKSLRNIRTEKLPTAEPKNVSATRGIASPCGDQKSFVLELAATSEAVVLKWDKVSNAVKYHLYISDEEEILIDEYETIHQTSYVLQKQLDKGKVYKWKVVIELENGQTIIAVSQKFKSSDFQASQKGSVKRLNAEIRCSSSN